MPVCVCVCVCVCTQMCVHAQLCLTLCDIIDCSPPDSSVHGISQPRILGDCHFFLQGILSDPVTEPKSLASPAVAGKFFTMSTTWEALYLGKISSQGIYKEPEWLSLGKESGLWVGMKINFILQSFLLSKFFATSRYLRMIKNTNYKDYEGRGKSYVNVKHLKKGSNKMINNKKYI